MFYVVVAIRVSNNHFVPDKIVNNYTGLASAGSYNLGLAILIICRSLLVLKKVLL